MEALGSRPLGVLPLQRYSYLKRRSQETSEHDWHSNFPKSNSCKGIVETFCVIRSMLQLQTTISRG